MSSSLSGFAYSFSHAIIKFDDKQYTGLKSIKFSQDVDRAVTRGASRKPEKKTEGELQLGDGTASFSDLSDAMRFLKALGKNPSGKMFAIDATFANTSTGETASFEMLGCSLSGFEASFEQGADAMGLDIPFDFMMLKIDGVEFGL